LKPKFGHQVDTSIQFYYLCIRKSTNYSCGTWGFQGDEDSSRVERDAV